MEKNVESRGGRAKNLLCCAAVAALVLLDQLSKLAVRAAVPEDAPKSLFYTQSGSGWFMFHLHPLLHDRYPLPVDLLVVLFAVAVIAGLAVYFKYERAALLDGVAHAESVKSCPGLTRAAFVFITAGAVCSVLLDAFVWGGSLDFICFEWARFYTDGAEPYTMSYQIDVDPKDVFLNVGTVLILIRLIIFKASQLRLPKDERKLVKSRENHILRSLRRAMGLPETQNKIRPLDVLEVAALSIVMPAMMGYLMYIAAIWLIIPIADWLIPPIDKFLTDIGNNYESELIYDRIRSGCLFIALFPGVGWANTLIKGRERLFIHDTNGMIPRREGLKYHLQNYLFADVLAVVLTVAAGSALSLLGLRIISPFTLLFDVFGAPLGILTTAVSMAAAQVLGILFAQNKWRAEFFYGD